jgi:outer membrane receptor protein involved in Fe transport
MTNLNQSEKNISLKKKLIVTSMAAALGLTGAPAVLAQNATLEEIIVTSRQRAESSQDIPMTISTVSGEDIQKQGITTLEDFSRFVGGLNVASTAPGQNTIVFRGVSDGGGFLVDPTAAIYLDEQAMSMTSMAPDIYPVDIARIEALSGPQSTLFGASSQTGTVRVITNKPDTEGSEITGNIGMGVNTVNQGEMGFDVDATVNIPVIEDKFAIRMSGFSAEDGGYIDSVEGMTVVDPSSGAGGLKSNLNAQNPHLDTVESDINGVEWSGGRIQATWIHSDDWTSTLSHNFQSIEANGFNDFDPEVGDLETVKFYDEYRTDDWKQTSLVIEGDLGFATLTVAGSYYDRETLYQHDTQSYAAYFHYVLGAYYATYDFGTDPIGYLTNDQQNESTTLEVRLSHSGDKVSWTAGAFYMDSDEYWDFYSYVDNYTDSPAFAAWTATAAYYDNMELADTNAWWYSHQGTNRKDLAVFGEIDIQVTDRLALLLGGRYYEVDRYLSYGVEKPAGYAQNVVPDRTDVDDGFIPKVGVQYDLTDNMMVWAVYSEGYRVGGVNRARGEPTLPLEYESDTIENMELGLKSSFMDDTIQINATVYEMVWKGMQLELTDPSFSLTPPQPWQAVVANLGNAEVSGMDLDVTALLTDNLQVGFNITKMFHAYVNPMESYPDPRFEGGQASLGLDPQSDLPFFADMSYSMYIDYSDDMKIMDLEGELFARFQHSYEGESLNQLGDGAAAPKQISGNYRITDLIVGYDLGDWKAQLSLNNIGDERGITYKDSSDYDPYFGQNSDNVIRPRNYNFSIRRYF